MNIITLISAIIIILFIVLVVLQMIYTQNLVKNIKTQIQPQNECTEPNVHAVMMSIDAEKTIQFNDPESIDAKRTTYDVSNSRLSTIHHFVCGNSFKNLRAAFKNPIHLVINDNATIYNKLINSPNFKYCHINNTLYYFVIDRNNAKILGENKTIISLFKIKADPNSMEILDYSREPCVDNTISFTGNNTSTQSLLDIIKQSSNQNPIILQSIFFSM